MSLPFVRSAILRERVESTSDLAKDLAAQDRHALPMVVRALRQTRGRGRGSNAWWSDVGSLAFTIVIDPVAQGLRPEHESRLALASAIAVIDAIEALAPEVEPGIRWPNDVEADHRKLGGILPERVETENGPRLVIGIGLNVLTRLEEAPTEVRRMAASLADLTRRPLTRDDLEVVYRAILERFPSAVDRLARDDPEQARRWDELDTLRDRWVRVDQGTRLLEGLGRGIDPQGALCLAGEGGPFRVLGGQVLREVTERRG